jgi:rod shape-determining protein MreC
MRLLFLLLWRNNFTLFFILLQALCLYFLIRNSRFQQASIFNATNKVVTTTMEGVSYVKEYIHLRDNNNSLAEENARLRGLLNDAHYVEDSTTVLVNDTLGYQQYSYLPARVINNAVHHRNNFITLNKGSKEGVQPEMAVITSNGVVGIVNHVSDHYCTVMSLLHKETNISAMIRSNGFFGSLKWDGENPDYVYLNEIDKTVPVRKGDTVVTTSFSAIFPAGVQIGKVEETKIEPGSPFFRIKVKLFMSFRNLSHVYIVKNLLKEEQRKLEDLNKKKEEEQ